MLHYVWKNKAYIMIWQYKSNKTLSITICHLDIIPKTAFVTNLGGNMARFTQFPIMITRSTIIYEIISPGAAGSSIYV